MTRVALYARYSTENQSVASIEDQFRICREHGRGSDGRSSAPIMTPHCSPAAAAAAGNRYGCLNHFRKGICDNGRTIRRDDIERRVLAGLTEKMVSPEAVAEAVRVYAEETNRQNHERRAEAVGVENSFSDRGNIGHRPPCLSSLW